MLGPGLLLTFLAAVHDINSSTRRIFSACILPAVLYCTSHIFGGQSQVERWCRPRQAWLWRMMKDIDLERKRQQCLHTVGAGRVGRRLATPDQIRSRRSAFQIETPSTASERLRVVPAQCRSMCRRSDHRRLRIPPLANPSSSATTSTTTATFASSSSFSTTLNDASRTVRVPRPQGGAGPLLPVRRDYTSCR